MMKEDGMSLASVRTPEQDYVGFFRFAIRTGAAARSEDRRQTGDAGGMSSSVAAIDIVRPHDGTNKLLRHIVQLVGGFRTTEHPEVAWVLLLDGATKGLGNTIKGLFPCCRTMSTVFTDERLGQASFERDRHAIRKF